MPSNFLEDLVAEWYEYNGYFVKQNVRVGRRQKGGYESELDIVAFHPTQRHLVHVEPSMDAESWAECEERYQKKFAAGRKHLPLLFLGMDLPDHIEQIALLGFASKKGRDRVGGGKIMLVEELLERIVREFARREEGNIMIPEQHPILRTFQLVADYRDAVLRALSRREA